MLRPQYLSWTPVVYFLWIASKADTGWPPYDLSSSRFPHFLLNNTLPIAAQLGSDQRLGHDLRFALSNQGVDSGV